MKSMRPKSSIEIPNSSQRDVAAQIWVISDLQTPSSEEAEHCLGTAIEDIAKLEGELDYIWYLGDAITGTNLAMNRQVTETQVGLLEQLGTPLRFVMGNHDLDSTKDTGEFVSPFYDVVRSHENWRTTANPDEFYFFEEIGNWTALFLSDHVDADGQWSVTHGKIHGDSDRYPYTAADYREVSEQLKSQDRPVIAAGHNAFPGGNRPAEIQRQFFPLPENIRLHLYGHAHIGDEEWVGEHAYRTISYIDHHRIPQVDVASLEERRGDTVRSAILNLYTGGECGVFVRDHRQEVWLESYHVHTKSSCR